jgi:hypothetical protein
MMYTWHDRWRQDCADALFSGEVVGLYSAIDYEDDYEDDDNNGEQ